VQAVGSDIAGQLTERDVQMKIIKYVNLNATCRHQELRFVQNKK